MNTGAEAVETGLKLARKWGYKVKKIPEGQVPASVPTLFPAPSGSFAVNAF